MHHFFVGEKGQVCLTGVAESAAAAPGERPARAFLGQQSVVQTLLTFI